MLISTQIHGHRGCGGAFPPNTIPAFLQATALGCHWLEMDVVITGDGQVLVSHEPWMDHSACRGPEGQPITREAGRALNIFQMPLHEVQQYRTVEPGSGKTSRKPTLAEVWQAVDELAKKNGKAAPQFNIEVKSEPRLYGTYQPLPAAYAGLVVKEIEQLGITHHCLIQSFDPKILQEVHGMAPSIPLALLVDNAGSLDANLGLLNFTPAYYSPEHHLIDQPLVDQCRQKGIGLLAWTVNDVPQMQRMIDLGVDGLITDKPKEAMALLAARQ